MRMHTTCLDQPIGQHNAAQSEIHCTTTHDDDCGVCQHKTGLKAYEPYVTQIEKMSTAWCQ